MQADEEFPGVQEVPVRVGDAEFDTRALVGDASFENDDKDVRFEDPRPVEAEHGAAALVWRHGVVGRFSPTTPSRWGRKTSNPSFSSFYVRLSSKDLSAGENSGAAK